MNELQWHQVVDKVQPYIVRIHTPNGIGTGFIVSHTDAGDLYGIATAAHVVEHAHEWELPIRIEHYATQKKMVLHHSERAIFLDSDQDSAAIVFNKQDMSFPVTPPSLIEEGKKLKVGVEVAWVGFPAVSLNKLCFFSGRISADLDNESGYLVDGVAINGVSGGPALCLLGQDSYSYMGVVSAYIPNRSTGETLPGLAVVRDVSQFYDIINKFHSLDDARNQSREHENAIEPATETSSGSS